MDRLPWIMLGLLGFMQSRLSSIPAAAGRAAILDESSLASNFDQTFQPGHSSANVLETLPEELLLAIISHLDLISRTALLRTDHLFARLCHLQHVHQAQRIKLLLEAQSRPSTLKHEFACFTCCRLLSEVEFAEKQMRGKRSKTGELQHMRFCIECGIRCWSYKPGSIIRQRYLVGKVCRECGAFERFDGCKDCRNCALCPHIDGEIQVLTVERDSLVTLKCHPHNFQQDDLERRRRCKPAWLSPKLEGSVKANRKLMPNCILAMHVNSAVPVQE